MTVTVSAPGSIMITGEHAVVYGAPAIVCAIEQRITVQMSPREDRVVEIDSEIAPKVDQSLDALESTGPMRFVISAVQRYTDRLASGLNIKITSEIDPTLGLGSSAAVTAACLVALDKLAGTNSHFEHLHLQALSIVRALQGRGSGADLAASLFGGVISYQLPETLLSGVPNSGETAKITQLPKLPPLGLRYAGYKTPTGEVLAKIADEMVGHEAEYDALYRKMGECSARTIAAVRDRDWECVAQELNVYQGFMSELGVSDNTLDEIIAEAKGAMAVKISGSGLGDCVLSMGDLPDGFAPAEQAEHGAILHG